jgi:acyl-CoA reductase-like NAD-dependent aldehyde dehydrogenase
MATALEFITAEFQAGNAVTLKVSPETIAHARDLMRLAQRRTGRDVSQTLIGDKLHVEVVS